MASTAQPDTLSDAQAGAKERPLALANWLLFVAVLVLIIVGVGGITRLTESGLSITEWNVVTGILPPVSDTAWQAEFDLYRQTAEYKFESGPAGMDLAAFKFIYFWEWFHRLLGRVIGLAYALPFTWFWIKGAIPKGYTWRLFAMMSLIGLQGALGWYMVSSGVGDTDLTDVSHFRLSAHLLTAFFLLAGLVWTALDLRQLAKNGDARPAGFTGLAWVTSIILFVQMLLGAWVAGLNAGHVTKSWPTMVGGDWFPPVDWSNGAIWAFTHDPFLLHWLHRWWAWIAVIALVIMSRAVRKAGSRPASIAIHSAFGVQILLGIATVMTGVSLWIAVLHQFVGALLVPATAWGAHQLGRK